MQDLSEEETAMAQYYAYLENEGPAPDMIAAWHRENLKPYLQKKSNYDYYDEIIQYEYKNHYKPKGKTMADCQAAMQLLFFNRQIKDGPWIHNLMYIWWHAQMYTEFKKNYKTKINEEPVYFVTVGFNNQTWTPYDVKKTIQNILANNKILVDSYGVFELFRTNGEHPHCHFKIILQEKLRPSKIAEFIYRTKGVSKVVLKATFIDVKSFQPYHEEYLKGNKVEEKLIYCQQDKQWRELNDFPPIFHKI